MGAPDLRLIDMTSQPPKTTAEKIVVVNIVIMAICVPLLVLCLLRQLWFPALVFAMLTFSNGLQLRNRERGHGFSDDPPQ